MESIQQPLTPTEINADKLNYGTPRREGSYHRSPIVYGETNSSFILQSAPLKLVGVSKSALELGITDKKATRSKQFYKAISKLESHAMYTIHTNSKKWFGQDIPVDKIKQMYRSCIFPSETIGGDINIRLKISRDINIFDEEKNVIDIESLDNLDKEKTRLSCICRIDGLLFGRNTTKLDIKIAQIKIVKLKPKPKEIPKPREMEVEQEQEITQEEVDVDSDMEEISWTPKKEEEKEKQVVEMSTEDTKEEIISNENDIKTIVLGEGEKKEETENVKSLEYEELCSELSRIKVQLEDSVREGKTEDIEKLACEMAVVKDKIINL